MHADETQLKLFLLDSGLVSKKDIENAEKKSVGKSVSFGEALVIDGKLSEDDLRKAEAYILGIPFINLSGQKIDFDILALIPEPIARNHNIVAFKKTSDALEVAMLDTDDLVAIDFIKKKVGLRILPRLTSTESMKSVLKQYQRGLKAEFGDILDKEIGVLKTFSAEKTTETPENEEDLKKLAEDLPIIRIVDTLLTHAILQGASDIHVEPLEREFLIRYRIDGILHDAMTLPKAAAPGITARIKVLSRLKLDEKRLPQDGRFRIETEEQKVSFRVSVIPTFFGEKVVLRLLRENTKGFTLERIGLHGAMLERVHEATKQKAGMILVTGPTGSGKTTALYAILDILNLPEVNISTIEGPVEYQIPRVNQTQVKPDIGFTFANGLRSLVRQDPDIIMVGEIRDNETASLAINAALTGHLVLSTLHTNSAAGAIPRLIDMKAEPFLLASTVHVIIAERLVRELCATKEKYFLKTKEIDKLREKADLDRVLLALKEENIISRGATWNDVPFHRPKKSSECEDGYQSRRGIFEVLNVTPTIKELILKDATSDAIEAQARKEGMTTMIEDGIFKCVAGITSLEEVLRVVSE